MAFSCSPVSESVKCLSRISRVLLLVLVILAGAGGVVGAKGTVVPQQGVDASIGQKPAWLDYMPVVTVLLGITSVIIILYQRKRRIKDEIEKNKALSAAERNAEQEQKDADNKKYAERYQTALAKELNKSSLPASNALDSFSVKLTDTFVSLRLSETWKSDTKFIPDKRQERSIENHHIRTPEEVMALVFEKFPLMLVIGDPGSGKTTLLRHYALTSLNKEKKEGYKTLGFTEPVMVFYLALRELKKSGFGYDSLADNLFSWSEDHQLGIPKALFLNWLHDQKTLVLLDGLDEISNVDDRIKVCKWIDQTFAGLVKARVVVTSRTTGYRKGDGIEIETEHVRADIMDFSPEQQATFLKRWFNAALLRDHPLDAATQQEKIKSDALKKAETIIAYLAKEENKSLQALAGVPLLLQIMATLWKDRQYLPGSRVKLYDAALDYMLDYRDRQKNIEPLLPAEKARRVLTPVSLWMQEELQKDEAPRAEVQARMQEKLKTQQNPPTAENFCKNLVDRAGLLVEYGDTEYMFRHKSFREFMAGVQLKDDRPYERLNKLVTHFGDDWWEEPLRFFIGQVDEKVFDLFMQKLFDSPVTDTLTPKKHDLLLILMKEALETKTDALQAKLLDPKTTPNRQRYLMDCLKTIGTGNRSAIDVVSKFAESGITDNVDILRYAAEITRKQVQPEMRSDVEKGVSGVVMDKLGAQYILIKGGTFRFSLTERQETVPDLYVAKYTVTNQHYRRFISYLASQKKELERIVSVEEYKERLYAMATGIKGFGDYLQKEKELASLFRSGYDDNKKFNKDDQPVAWVSWYGARAYCLWLSLLEGNALYRLPTEKEWEYAAGGRESRTYPWGVEEPSLHRANFNENEGTTTPVGRYPEGATPEGLYDMAGNVWEWTEDWYDEDKNWRSIRGAYYSSNADALRCSSRDYYDPRSYLNDYYVGFRVIRSSHSST
jgi:formylglycine-generating enzyme required for sulfatase activity/energy-coupling factor transporter ATP-binding protein EcfA2